MSNANKYSCDILRNPQSTKFLEDIRVFQGCPTLAVTGGGRIYAGWYAGGLREPHMDNYNILVYSDDGGQNWSKPLIIIPSNRERLIHALDIQLFVDKQGVLHVCWVQNNVLPESEIKPKAKAGQPLVTVDGHTFGDFGHSQWEITCENPDAENPIFSEPKYIFKGFMRCKPTFLENGDIIYFAYDQLNDCYGYNISRDNGKTFERYYAGKKLATYFDEAMAYQMKDGRVRMLARTSLGELAECYSEDNGISFSDAKKSGIVCANTRFFVSRTPSGRIILVTNDSPDTREKITVYLSEDDGKSWKYKKCIDERLGLSYPDVDFYKDRIYITYDRGREFARQILFADFTEQDIIDNNDIEIKVISEPKTHHKFYKETIIKEIEKHKIIAILRGVADDKLLPVAQALYDGGIGLLEVTFKSDGSENQATAEKIKTLCDNFGDKMMIGAGTVLTVEQVRLAKAAGALYAISPNANENVIKETCRVGMVSIPGAFTPTEIAAADSYGADFIKLFPTVSLSKEYIKAVKAPLSHIRLLAVGGIDTENISDYIKCGVCGFGIGSNIVKADLVEKGDYAAITALAAEFIKAAKGEENE